MDAIAIVHGHGFVDASPGTPLRSLSAATNTCVLCGYLFEGGQDLAEVPTETGRTILVHEACYRKHLHQQKDARAVEQAPDPATAPEPVVTAALRPVDPGPEQTKKPNGNGHFDVAGTLSTKQAAPASQSQPAEVGIEITLLTKANGPLTKTISLTGSDSSNCRMAKGNAKRMLLSASSQASVAHAADAILTEFAKMLIGLKSDQAIALGRLRDGLPDSVAIEAKDKIDGATGAIARTSDNITYSPGKCALTLFDFDGKGRSC
jgi:hypothetical protein